MRSIDSWIRLHVGKRGSAWGCALAGAALVAACSGTGSNGDSGPAAAEVNAPERGVQAAAASGGSGSGAAAKGESVYTEAGKLIRGDESLVALGDEMFGDRVDLYSGGLEFVQNDVSVPGNSPLPVAVGRRHTAPVSLGSGAVGSQTGGHFGDWELEIPRLQGVFANLTTSWTVGGWSGDQALQRCSRFGPPPVMSGPQGSAFNPDEYWHGSFLYVPGSGTQEILIRNGATQVPSDGAAYPLTTKNRWAFRCLPALANAAGEGFVAVAPDGTQYRFDWLVSRPYIAMVKGTQAVLAQAVTAAGTPQRGGGATTDSYAGGYMLQRKEVWILPTQITDRHGNTVTYTYSSSNPWQLLSIQGSDAPGNPRVLNFSYDGSSNRITRVTQGNRAWAYNYRSTAGGYVLSSLTLPDGSAWSFNLDALTYGAEMAWASAETCDGWNELNTTPHSGSMTSPSGATGTFVVAATRHGRSDVTYECLGDDGVGHGVAAYAAYTDRFSITSKTISGPGLPANKTWTYAYGPANVSFSPCNGCATTKTVTVTSPESSVTRYTFGNRFRQTEGQLQLTEEGWDGSSALRTTVRQYRSPAAGPYPDPVGYSTQRRGNGELAARHAPESYKAIVQQGVAFVTQANAFDAQARPINVGRSSSLGDFRTDLTAYDDNLTRWVLGQVAVVTNADSGQVVEQNVYDPLTADVQTRYSFGRYLGSFSYWGDGTLRSRSDSLGQATNFSNYTRGLAQSVIYADGSSESATVDVFGSITAVTNAAGSTSGYAYDILGRLVRITPPGGDPVAYNPTTLAYEQVGFDEFGLAAGHWRQTIATGNARTVRYLDAQWRPLMTRTWDLANESGTRRVTQVRHDREGRKVFESYPQRDIASVFADGPGTTTRFDTLGRVVQQSQTSELGPLITSTDYLANFQRLTVNPRKQRTLETFQAFDNPAESNLRHADLPAGVALDIDRDRYGKALAITRSGGAKSVTRRFVYDGLQRLCKMIEPETGATVQAYIGHSTNLAWKASGQGATNPAACDNGNVAGSTKISYTYDVRNRLVSTVYGDGSAGIARGYTPDGLLSQISSGGYTWAYSYNRRRLLTQEQLAWPGVGIGAGWNFSWTADANGKTATLQDPWGQITYSPNALGEPTQVSGYASAISHYPNGAVAGYTLANGISRVVQLNVRNLPEVMQDSGVLRDHYSYDENGNPRQIADEQEGGATTRNLGYDGLDRLTVANGLWGVGSYSYDALDNLVASTVGGRSLNHNIDPATNRLRSLSGSQDVALSYDANGNVVQRGGQTFRFDIGNRLQAVPGKASYIYDGHGRRVSTAFPGGSSRLQAYTVEGKLRFEYRPGEGATRHVYLGQQLIAETRDGGATTFLHTDALGSPVARSNSGGAILSRTRYEPYGATAAGTNPTGIGFTGHVNDADTGLVYMQQRYYDAVAGRFLSVDPVTVDIQTGSAFGRYHYANNNPQKYVDLDGQYSTNACVNNPGASCESFGAEDAPNGAVRNSMMSNAGVQVAPTFPVLPASGTVAGSGISIYGSAVWVVRLAGSVSLAVMPSSLGDGSLYGASGLYAAKADMIIYRVWGGEASALGRSWTPVNPELIGSAYRNMAGLPDINDGTKLSIGILFDPAGVVARPAIPLDGNRGGLPELRIPNPESQVRVIHTKTMSTPF